MSKIVKSIILGLAVAFLFSFGNSRPAFAKEHKGHAKEHRGKEHKGKEHQGTPPGWKKGKKKGWEGGSEPPGWTKAGEKARSESM